MPTKIEKCVCGKKPLLLSHGYAHTRDRSYVECHKCFWRSGDRATKSRAISAWNKVMGAVNGKH